MIRRCRVKSVRMVSLLLMGWSAAGCADGTRLSTLESELALMRADIAVLRDSVHEVASDLAVHKVLESWGDFALLYPGDDGYSLLRTDLGALTVSLEDVQPYASGSRITLQFGNLTNATIEGVKATLDWGQALKPRFPDNESMHSKEVSLTEALRPGRWNNVSFVLDGVPPTELGFVRVKNVNHSGIRLLR